MRYPRERQIREQNAKRKGFTAGTQRVPRASRLCDLLEALSQVSHPECVNRALTTRGMSANGGQNKREAHA